MNDLLDGTPYASYSYAYPHKTAYRPLHLPLPLSEVELLLAKSAYQERSACVLE